MAGTLFGLGLSQQVSASGTPLSGCLLYVYQENSSTPVTTYSDFTLATEQTFPIEADSAGRLPQIWVADGSYRARLTTSAGVEVFDEASVTAIGASSQSGGSVGGTSVDSATIFDTGDVKWRPVAGSLTGWVRANGRTIGSGASSATERANADTQALFEYLWNNFTNGLCAVSGGRGATAAADFSANKTIATFTMQGRAPFGLDDMGGSAASVISGATAVAVGGAETTTIAQANLPNVSLSSTALTATPSQSIVITAGSQQSDNTHTGSGNFIQSVTSSALTVAVAGTVPLGGSGTALNKMPPYMLGTFYIKL
jgi:microcystin-dependent protein